jgi:hypothetical protein
MLNKATIINLFKVNLSECLIFFGPSKHPREVHELLCSLFISTGGDPCGTCERVQIPVSIKK